VVYLTAPGRWFRCTVGLAVLVTAGVVPVAMLTGWPRPPLSVLLPQVALGVVALGAPRRRPWWVRLVPLAAAAASVPVAAGTVSVPDFYVGQDRYSRYCWVVATTLPAMAVMLLIGATLLALGLAARRDSRGVWALLILLTPIGTLALNPLGAVLDDAGPGRPLIPAWHSMVVASVLVAVVGSALVPLALAARGRLSLGARPLDAGGGRCPTCGAPTTST